MRINIRSLKTFIFRQCRFYWQNHFSLISVKRPWKADFIRRPFYELHACDAISMPASFFESRQTNHSKNKIKQIIILRAQNDYKKTYLYDKFLRAEQNFIQKNRFKRTFFSWKVHIASSKPYFINKLNIIVLFCNPTNSSVPLQINLNQWKPNPAERFYVWNVVTASQVFFFHFFYFINKPLLMGMLRVIELINCMDRSIN